MPPSKKAISRKLSIGFLEKSEKNDLKKLHGLPVGAKTSKKG